MPTGYVLSVDDKYKLLVSIIRQQMDGQGVLRDVNWDRVGNELGLTSSVSRRRWNSLRREIEGKKAPRVKMTGKVKAKVEIEAAEDHDKEEGDAAMRKGGKKKVDHDRAADQAAQEKTSDVDMFVEDSDEEY